MTAPFGSLVSVSALASLLGLVFIVPWSRRRSPPTARLHVLWDAPAIHEVDPVDPYLLLLVERRRIATLARAPQAARSAPTLGTSSP